MLTPRNPKELAKMLGNDLELRQKVHGAIARADDQLEKDLLDALRSALRRSHISLSLLDHSEATRGIKRYYESIRAAGRFCKLW